MIAERPVNTPNTSKLRVRIAADQTDRNVCCFIHTSSVEGCTILRSSGFSGPVRPALTHCKTIRRSKYARQTISLP